MIAVARDSILNFHRIFPRNFFTMCTHHTISKLHTDARPRDSALCARIRQIHHTVLKCCLTMLRGTYFMAATWSMSTGRQPTTWCWSWWQSCHKRSARHQTSSSPRWEEGGRGYEHSWTTTRRVRNRSSWWELHNTAMSECSQSCNNKEAASPHSKFWVPMGSGLGFPPFLMVWSSTSAINCR